MEAVNEWNQWRRQIWGCEGQRNLYHAYKALILSVHLPEYVQWSLRYVLCIHILLIKRVDSALPNMTIQFRNDCHKIHISEIPAWNTSRLSMWFVIWLLNGGGAMHAWYGCACLPICQIRQRRIYAESDVAIDRHIRIMHAWPYHHLIPNNKSYEKSWRIPCRDHWGMNFMTVISKLYCHIWQCWICS